MLQLVQLIQRRHPRQAKSVILGLLTVSALGLIVGICLAISGAAALGRKRTLAVSPKQHAQRFNRTTP